MQPSGIAIPPGSTADETSARREADVFTADVFAVWFDHVHIPKPPVGSGLFQLTKLHLEETGLGLDHKVRFVSRVLLVRLTYKRNTAGSYPANA